MQGVVKVSFIVVCLLLTLHSTRSASNETARQQVSTDTPELWTALGCFVNENNITICNQRVGKKKKYDEDDDDEEDVKRPDSSEDDGPGFFEAISDFMSDGVKFFEGESYKDKEGSAVAVEEEDNEEDAEDKLNKKRPNDDDDDYDDDDDDYDADEKEDDDDYDDDKDDDDDYDDDDRDEYDDDDNVVNTSNRTSLSARRKRDSNSQHQGEQSKKRKKKKSSGLMKLMMLGMFLKSKLSTFMMIFGTILQLKFFGIAVLNLVVGLVRLIVELSKKKESQKIIYYEQAHHEHEHVYDQKTEDDKGWLSGWLSKQDQPTAQELAYKAYAPHS